MRNHQKPEPPTPGFAIRLTGQTELGIGMLIVEDHLGGYVPVGPVATIDEAREIAENDLQLRMRDLERGKTPFCPEIYKVWAQGVDGYAVAAEFDPSRL